jgi:hypothetical protein
MIDHVYRLYARFGEGTVFLFTWNGDKQDGIDRAAYESHLRGMDDWDEIVAIPQLHSRLN